MIIQLAKEMGGTVTEAFPWDDYQGCLEETLEEFESLLDDIAQERIANQERVSQTYRELLEVITTEEWTQLAKARDKALQNAINALEPI